MKRRFLITVLGMLFIPLAMARADERTRVPAAASVLQDTERGEACAVLQFDLSGIPESEVSEAIVDWRFDAVPSDRRSSFELYHVVAEASWGEWMNGNVTQNATDELVDVWEFYPEDYAANGGGYVRFVITDQVRDILSQGGSVLRLVVKTTDVDQIGMSQALSALQLIVR